MDYAGWCALSDQELARHDIAEVNLLCALGLPGSEGLDVAASCQQLDHWAELVRRAIDHYQPQYKRNPDRFDGSPGKFRMEVLVSVLQLELGVKYYEPFKNTFHAYDSRAVFAHGVLSGFGGTCVSLPVINVAVGRRLGYPLYLVESREHCFARWDEPGGERFNIECAGRGFGSYDDAYYRRQMHSDVKDSHIEAGTFLGNLSRRSELAYFFSLRSECYKDHLQLDQSLESLYYARQLAPKHPTYSGAQVVLTIINDILLLMRFVKPTEGMPLDEQIELATPPAVVPWREWGNPRAQEELKRIVILQARKRGLVREAVLPELCKKSDHADNRAATSTGRAAQPSAITPARASERQVNSAPRLNLSIVVSAAGGFCNSWSSIDTQPRTVLAATDPKSTLHHTE